MEQTCGQLASMGVKLCEGLWADVCVVLFVNMCVGMWEDICVDLNVDMCKAMWGDLCIDVYADLFSRHVPGNIGAGTCM